MENKGSAEKKDKKIVNPVTGSIAGKLLVTLLPMITIFIVIVATVIFFRARTVIVDEAQSGLLQESKANAADIGIRLENVRAYYKAVTDVLENIDFGGREGILEKFNYTKDLRKDMYPGFFGVIEGSPYMDMTGWEPGADFDVTSRAWYQTGSGKSEMTWGTPYVDGTNGGMNVSTAREITLPTGEKGVIAADLYLKDLAKEVEEYTPYGTGKAVLFDDTNVIIACENIEYIGKKGSELTSDKFMMSIGEAVASATSEIQVIKGNDKKNYYVAMVNVPNTNWTMVSYVSEKDVLADLNRLLYITVMLVIIMLMISIAIISFIVKVLITRTVAKLNGNIVRITENDFTVDIVDKGNDEISRMNSNMKAFISNMRDSLNELHSESDDLNMLAESSKSASENMNNSAREQSTNMLQIRDAMDGISTAVTELAENATELANMVSDLTGESQSTGNVMEALADRADQGKKDMGAVTSSMSSIADSMQETNSVVMTVEASAKRIEGIVLMINNIADQTNLLSLNASIEAARAGEVGKGFAVVASEIGTLANESSNASNEIGEIITEVMKQINDLAEKSDNNMRDLSKSTEAVEVAQNTFANLIERLDATTESMKKIIKMIGDIDSIATNVAAISEEQSASAQEIMATVDEVTKGAEGVATDSLSVSEAAGNVAKSADAIRKFVDTFKLS